MLARLYESVGAKNSGSSNTFPNCSRASPFIELWPTLRWYVAGNFVPLATDDLFSGNHPTWADCGSVSIFCSELLRFHSRCCWLRVWLATYCKGWEFGVPIVDGGLSLSIGPLSMTYNSSPPSFNRLLHVLGSKKCSSRSCGFVLTIFATRGVAILARWNSPSCWAYCTSSQ